MAVKNWWEGSAVAIVHREFERFSEREFLADALVDQHVRIDRNTDREHQSRHAGQRERSAKRREHGHREEQIDEYRHIRNDPTHDIIKSHEDHDGEEAPDNRGGSFRYRIRAERRPDDRLLNNFYRRRQRAGFEYDLEEIRFAHVADAGDLRVAARNFAIHTRGGIHYAIEDNRHLFADAGMRHAAPDARAFVIHLHVHFRLTRVLVNIRLRVCNHFSGKFRLAVQKIELIDTLVLPGRQRAAKHEGHFVRIEPLDISTIENALDKLTVRFRDVNISALLGHSLHKDGSKRMRLHKMRIFLLLRHTNLGDGIGAGRGIRGTERGRRFCRSIFFRSRR